MSLFPAYSDNIESQNNSNTQDEKAWLINTSFIPLSLEQNDRDLSLPGSSVETFTSPDDEKGVSKKRKNKEKKKKQKKECSDDKSEAATELVLEFTGRENYYVDKTSQIGYLKVGKLHNPACPRYHSSNHVLGKPKRYENFKHVRYFARKPKKSDQVPDKEGQYQLSEEEFLKKNKEFNTELRKEPGNITKWVEFINFQSQGLLKSSTTNIQVAERKIGILNKALTLNACNEELYALYVDIVTAVYPSFEVSKILDKLLAKDPTNYTLWNAQILATQNSMARCIVPDVLSLYNKSMDIMYRKLRNDFTMIRLFTSCAFFLRQAGLLEQFFALIKLALELNVSQDKFTGIEPLEADQNTLVEFEEVVLNSGLPMNEIWLRIEKLRTSFNFLPCPTGMSCTDPQRSVFNEDVCHFIYPLMNQENSLELIFNILRLLKIPLPHYKAFQQTSSLADLDAPEEFLNLLLFCDLGHDAKIRESTVSLIRELAVGPSFMSSWIGNDIYIKVIGDIILKLADCHKGRQRCIFIILWIRFQRILVIISRLEGKLDDKNAKSYRRTIKSELKREENRNEVIYFTEYALLEYEIGATEVAESIFMGAMANSDGCVNADRFYTAVTFCEMWLKNGDRERALAALSKLAIGLDTPQISQKLLILKKFQDLLANLVQVERYTEEMRIEQLILPDYLINLIKACVYTLFLVKSFKEVLSLIQYLKKIFIGKNRRHSFIQENIYELLVNLESLEKCGTNFEDVSEALTYFPENIFLAKCLIAVQSVPWYKLKGILIKCSTPQSILMLVVAARLRHVIHEEHDPVQQRSLQLRVLSALRIVTNEEGKLRKNPLMWRLHLRCAYELEASLHQCRNVLFAALDECPWNKSLYLDGAVYVPHELTQLQDLIIEKQLRIYALPEELEILRSDGN
ncbi:nuclear exosome regulator NRDE2 isoform X2 [Lutzomyia longipalpis]|uniref:nuclear exosome regulator NRDE2 isoform X2 n=1 Tax=Lutzomyia longipalpis TaxID=7200 RepID=UPI0024835E62|nr:nuclear exosome regulator NRDE2 isoform X2 [Lutzomyia longipalpis]